MRSYFYEFGKTNISRRYFRGHTEPQKGSEYVASATAPLFDEQEAKPPTPDSDGDGQQQYFGNNDYQDALGGSSKAVTTSAETLSTAKPGGNVVTEHRAGNGEDFEDGTFSVGDVDALR